LRIISSLVFIETLSWLRLPIAKKFEIHTELLAMARMSIS